MEIGRKATPEVGTEDPRNASRRRSFPRRAGSLVVALLVAAAGFLPTPASSNGSAPTLTMPPSRCRGSKDARQRITWPSASQQREYRVLRWPHTVPRRIGRWAYLIAPLARAYGVDPFLVAGVMRVESNGDPLIWNLDSDARGLMQVLHAPFQPSQNLRAGISMLSSLQRQFGQQDLVLAAYNAGPGSVEQYGGIPPYVETRDYVVLVAYYRDLFAGRRLSAARTARFKAAWADIVAYYRRICGRLDWMT